MKLPVIDELRKEDLPDAPEWIDPIINAYNRFAKFMYRALDRNLTIKENLSGDIIVLDKISQNDIDIGYKVKTRVSPSAVLIGKIAKRDVGSHETITDAVSIDWTYQDGFITIHNITGIDSTSNYNINLLVW